MLKSDIFRYRAFLVFEVLVVLCVMAIFRLIADRNLAGAVAGSVFFFSTLAVLLTEWMQVRRPTWAFYGAIGFFVLSVLPILFLRAATWGQPFNEAVAFGISGQFLHQTSSWIYFGFLIAIFVSLQQARIRVLRAQSEK